MTLPVVDGYKVRGLDGPDYKVGPWCCNPQCGRISEHAHHIIRRSKIGGDYKWVEIEGKTYANLTGVCPPCHDDLTGRIGGHKAAIRLSFLLDTGTFYWCRVRPGPLYDFVDPITPQPPTVDEVLASSRASGPSVEPSESCPTCGHVKTRRRAETLPARRRKSWTIKVPDDAEDGADVLDTLVDDLGLLLGIEPSQTGRYYIVLPAVYYAHQERARFIESLKGVGG